MADVVASDEIEAAAVPARLPTTPRWLFHVGLGVVCAVGLYSRSSILEEDRGLGLGLGLAFWSLVGLSAGWGARLVGHLWWRSGRALPSGEMSWVATSTVLLVVFGTFGLGAGSPDVVVFAVCWAFTYVAASGLLWLARVALGRIEAGTSSRPPRLGWYVLGPVMVGTTLLAMSTDLPRDARFHASAPALRHAVADITSHPAALDPATGEPRKEPIDRRGWIGLYPVTETCRRGRNVYFTVAHPDQSVGVAYAPRPDQLDDSMFIGEPSCVGNTVEFTHLTGPWYAWAYSD